MSDASTVSDQRMTAPPEATAFPRPAYRPEIDGLRAVAIIPVVLFHAGFGVWSGGFVGVDVFFVISGYLITSILLNEMSEKRFSVGGFYERRIRRLVPPLIPVLLATWVCATLFYDISQYREFCQSLIASILAFANWFFHMQVGYFDGPAETKPLLHMWSLAIEEQFYIVFPPLLIAILALGRRHLKACLAVLFIISFAYSTWLVFSGHEAGAFYNSLARFWELLAGALLAAGIRQLSGMRATLARIAGIVMIGVGIFALTEDSPFPGPAALLPVVGTALIIWAGAKGRDPVFAVLASRPFVYVGKISYAWYIWHWPILVFMPFLLPDLQEAWYLPLIGVAASFVLSALSLPLIENPVRRKKVLTPRSAAYGLMAATVAVAFVISSPGFLHQASKLRAELVFGPKAIALTVLEREKDYYMDTYNLNFGGSGSPYNASRANYTCSYDGENTRERLLNCVKGQSAASNVLVIGDSIGRDTTHTLRLAYPDTNFIMLHQSSCPPADHQGRKRPCFPGLKAMLADIDEEVEISAVVLAFRYRQAEWLGVENSLADIRAQFDNVLMLGVTPVYSTLLGTLVQEAEGEMPQELDMSDPHHVRWDYYELAEAAHAMADKYDVTFVDVTDAFCSEEACQVWYHGDTLRPMVWDRQHLTRYGMKFYAEALASNETLRHAIKGEDAGG